jgi:release factor glutamine methyltransferase
VKEEPRPLVDVLLKTEAFLRKKGIPSPRLEAELLLAKVLQLPRLQLYLAHDRPLSPVELDALRPFVARRGQREPLSWILGEREFHRIKLSIEPGVLDPRPDTETLVEAALASIPEDEPGPIYVADVGCGSGAVGLAIAHARPAVRLFAIDLDETALRVTKRNVERLELGSRVAVLQGNLLEPIPAHRPIHWVVSNPPYISSEEIPTLQPEVSRFEPKLALDGGPDGLDVVRRLIESARRRVQRGLWLEIGHDQAVRATDLLRRAGFEGLSVRRDLGGIDRVVGGVVPLAADGSLPPGTSLG